MSEDPVEVAMNIAAMAVEDQITDRTVDHSSPLDWWSFEEGWRCGLEHCGYEAQKVALLEAELDRDKVPAGVAADLSHKLLLQEQLVSRLTRQLER